MTYGQVNIACRTGWRFIEPVPTTVHAPDWSTIDNCHSAAASVAGGAKWSLSIKIGADTPLWLYTTASGSSCPAAPVSSPTLEATPTPGAGGITAFPFIWNAAQMGPEYTDSSAQCVPVPWDTSFQNQLQTFINTVAHHLADYHDSLLDHVVVTGVNTQTAENIQPHCTASACGYPASAGATDLDNWASIVASPGCVATPGGCSGYYAKLGPAYDTIVGYWAKAFSSPTPFPFPSNVPLAAMFSDGPVFPFDNTGSNTTGLELLNQFVTDEGSQAIVMNNAAGVVGPPLKASLDPEILCYQGKTPCATPTPTASASIGSKKTKALPVARLATATI